ncbi:MULTISPECIES: peptide deformylase [Fusobacterium]|uniref:peptide deformylase n=1 Tax=Fusobacterium TaxID=848 RepID=UPI00147729CF|nr:MULTISPECIES: peptide deformylase [Fusobacterium]NME35248.1 peptide deformylase [Fusobacterium sp. FSA-380-WT-3A]
MLYEIRTYGDSCLNEKSEKVENITDEIKSILEDMVETMHEATGVGLAAPQVGINKRFFVLDVGDKIIRKIINPKILEMSEEYTETDEGCLSVPGIYKKVKRAARIKVKYQNIDGEVIEEEMTGFLAKAFQHEYDHLEGKLFIERISPVSRKIISKKLHLIKKETEKKLKK